MRYGIEAGTLVPRKYRGVSSYTCINFRYVDTIAPTLVVDRVTLNLVQADRMIVKVDGPGKVDLLKIVANV